MAHNSLHRYLFDNLSVRGEIVQLSDAYQSLTQGKDYPQPVKNLLGELMAATCLLTATLKFEGSITVQIQGNGPVSLLVINGNNHQVMRGTARWKTDALPESEKLSDFIGQGQMVITIEPTQGERYQGIVALEGDSIQVCLEDYFERSEQLKTRLWLRAGEQDGQAMAAGMLLQILPDETADPEDFSHLSQLTETVKNEELFTLSAEEVLYRLYHQEQVTVFPAKPVSFQCACSREKSATAICTLPESDIDALLAEQDHLSLDCDFCGAQYRFDAIDIAALRHQNGPSSDTPQ